MPLNMKARGPRQQAVKGYGVGRVGARCPPHTVAVPVNPLQQAGSLRSCLSQAGTVPQPGPLPRGAGNPGTGVGFGGKMGGQHGG